MAAWAAEEYGLDPARFVRPFWTGGDFEAFDYLPGAVVVDNPPFSILARIARWYRARGIHFFLFSPTLTLLTRVEGVCHIACGVPITYENGANVNTSFITDLEPDTMLRSAPTLYQAVKRENDKNEKARTKQLPKYIYPDNVITAAIAYQYSKYGVDYRVDRRDCARVSVLDMQKAMSVKSGFFGGGLLLSAEAAAERAAAERAAAERAAAERAAAERAAAICWQLSEREQDIVRNLGRR